VPKTRNETQPSEGSGPLTVSRRSLPARSLAAHTADELKCDAHGRAPLGLCNGRMMEGHAPGVRQFSSLLHALVPLVSNARTPGVADMRLGEREERLLWSDRWYASAAAFSVCLPPDLLSRSQTARQ
jgi:hypothetical protein